MRVTVEWCDRVARLATLKFCSCNLQAQKAED